MVMSYGPINRIFQRKNSGEFEGKIPLAHLFLVQLAANPFAIHAELPVLVFMSKLGKIRYSHLHQQFPRGSSYICAHRRGLCAQGMFLVPLTCFRKILQLDQWTRSSCYCS